MNKPRRYQITHYVDKPKPMVQASGATVDEAGSQRRHAIK